MVNTWVNPAIFGVVSFVFKGSVTTTTPVEEWNS
jgi:hypothetical protein